MKQRLAILVLLIGLLPSCATAQWYRFPGSGKAASGRPAQKPETADSTVRPAQVPQPADTVRQEEEPQDVTPTIDIPETVNVSLLLPLGTGSAVPSANFLEFYSGALLAARNLGGDGIELNLGCYDISDYAAAPTAWTLSQSDVIIGPVAPKDIMTELEICPEDKWIVSPLDPRAASLPAYLRVVHATSTAEDQIDDMVDWLIEEKTPQSSVIVVCNSSEELPESGRRIMSRLEENGIRYSTVSYNLLEGLEILEKYETVLETIGRMQFVIASENEAFIGDVVRNAGLLKYRGKDLQLYCTSRIRSFETIDSETFFNIGLRVSGSYFIDYESPEVKSFVLAYRALFGSEPGNFAFSGYDMVQYFTRLCKTYGRGWKDYMHEFRWRGLQSDFRFGDEPGKVGRSNKAVRRTVYNNDYTITLL